MAYLVRYYRLGLLSVRFLSFMYIVNIINFIVITNFNGVFL